MIWIIMIAFMIVGGIVSSRLKSKFKKYSQIPTLSGMSGKEIAERMLADNHIYDVKVISVPGKLCKIKPSHQFAIGVKASLIRSSKPFS